MMGHSRGETYLGSECTTAFGSAAEEDRTCSKENLEPDKRLYVENKQIDRQSGRCVYLLKNMFPES